MDVEAGPRPPVDDITSSVKEECSIPIPIAIYVPDLMVLQTPPWLLDNMRSLLRSEQVSCRVRPWDQRGEAMGSGSGIWEGEAMGSERGGRGIWEWGLGGGGRGIWEGGSL